ncbi:MAG: Adenylosuccinate lyase (EC [uncultured Paraburkholderia sp.]|nr:MAG: Adenylosuccinate lyase (EC [uncultured Paraburkholderia sp.]
MGAVPSHEFVRNLDDAILPDLWRRRTQLTADEMVSMVELVRRALRTYHPLELQALGEDKEELVAQFIYSKVLRLAPGHTETHACADSAPSNGYALCAYFRRYLIDCLRSAGRQRNVSMETDGIAQEIDLHAQALEDPVQSVLLQYGLDEQRVRLAARAFIESLDEPERIVLAGSLGWCSEGKGGLSAVAAQHRVPSYHYRAVKLGVTMKKTATAEDFSNTKIGRWLTDVLGIDIDNRSAILLALNLLAAESTDSEMNEAAA